ncbi:MAG: type II secretion system protein [Candidatus Pacebacteria bacterium]|jgi:prepilin-type N-terminal cleavage/methylation domain-containing protein|nr:type II secretion system protein [Candidatus Paceibacterota bacterium]
MKARTSGFTLIEVLIVVTVIGILSAVIYANFGDAGKQSRDSQRKADLRLVQNALELYKQDNGRYPEGCNGANGDGWSGEQGTNYACGGGDAQYIVGLAPKYIPVLPKDPKEDSGDYGYVYRTNADGTVYKFVARKTWEGDPFAGFTHDFAACDADDSILFASTPITGLPQEGSSGGNPAYAYSSCNRLSNGAGGWINLGASDCKLSNTWTSLAVWGGYADPTQVPNAAIIDTPEEKVEYGTEQIICDMPN